MSGLGNVTAGAVLDLLLGGTALAADATLYLALWKVMPDADGAGGTEVTAGDYARLAITNNKTNWTTASGSPRTVSNAVAFTWASPAASDWADETHELAGATLQTASSGGTQRMRFTLSRAKPILTGDTPSIGIGVLVATLQ